MDQKDFAKYVPVLCEKPFSLYPLPEVGGTTDVVATEWYERKFTYVIDSPTHVTIEDVQSHKTYLIPLALVEFANPGMLRLTRSLKVWNGGLV